jgi:hypothetical protein
MSLLEKTNLKLQLLSLAQSTQHSVSAGQSHLNDRNEVIVIYKGYLELFPELALPNPADFPNDSDLGKEVRKILNK